MVRAPSRVDADRRRLTRERGRCSRNAFSIPIESGLLSGQGVQVYDPLRRDRFEQLEALRTGDGRDLPPMLKEEIRRELDRIALVSTQLAVVERARDALSVSIRDAQPRRSASLAQRLGPVRLAPLAAIVLRSFGYRRRWRLTADSRPSLASSRRTRRHLEVGIAVCADDDRAAWFCCVVSRTRP